MVELIEEVFILRFPKLLVYQSDFTGLCYMWRSGTDYVFNKHSKLKLSQNPLFPFKITFTVSTHRKVFILQVHSSVFSHDGKCILLGDSFESCARASLRKGLSLMKNWGLISNSFLNNVVVWSEQACSLEKKKSIKLYWPHSGTFYSFPCVAPL